VILPYGSPKICIASGPIKDTNYSYLMNNPTNSLPTKFYETSPTNEVNTGKTQCPVTGHLKTDNRVRKA